jgi:hypothetical protein
LIIPEGLHERVHGAARSTAPEGPGTAIQVRGGMPAPAVDADIQVGRLLARGLARMIEVECPAVHGQVGVEEAIRKTGCPVKREAVLSNVRARFGRLIGWVSDE